VVGAFTVYAAAKVYPRPQTYKEFDLSAFGAIPVLDGGRIKPLDSVARANMLFISGRSDFTDAKDDTRPAILWLLETLAWGDPDSGPAADYRIFRIDNEQLLAELSLEERPGFYRYSWNEINKNLARFDKLYATAKGMDESKRELLHSKVLELDERMAHYKALATGRIPTLIPKARGSEEWESLAQIDERTISPQTLQAARSQAIDEIQQEMAGAGVDPEKLKQAELAQWIRKAEKRTRQLIRGMAQADRKAASPAAYAFGEILTAYKDNRPKGFSEAIAKYRTEYVEPLNPSFRDTTKFELAFNAASPFYLAAFLYVFAGVFMALSWLGWAELLRKTAMGLACVALTLHVGGLLGRMYLMGRPLVFVTNLYSSAVMIGAAGVAGCLVLERIFKNGVGLVVGTTIGASTVAIAHHLSTDGKDTLGNLVAVLDTNFWLASHVTTVTLGYTATYVAGLLGIVYIFWGLCFTTLSKEKHAALGNMLYGVTCSATMLSFVGTVLGGIWADQSWGRFWGWDPKENGAVLIVIWNALVLHARWAGIVKQRGMAVLAVVGIMVTTWSWFGTNQLGVGLHNYGFNKTLAEGCMWTWLASLVVIGFGLIPLRYWRSFAGTGLPRPESVWPQPAASSPATAQGQQQANPQPVAAPASNGSANGHQPKPGKRKAKRR
jgi:ABC-type transport system involved in cytochrome c biogenesis permease subunit